MFKGLAALFIAWFAPMGATQAASPVATILERAESAEKRGALSEAIALAEEALRYAEQNLGATDPGLLEPLKALARLYDRAGRLQDAETQYLRMAALIEANDDAQRADLPGVFRALGSVYDREGRHAEAELATRRATSTRKTTGEGKVKMREFEVEKAHETRSYTSNTRGPVVASSPAAPSPSSSNSAAAAKAVLPAFPWPPPASSASYVFPADVFKTMRTVGDVSSAILAALEKSGYVERSFFGTEPGGVALVTRLERIAPDGTPIKEPNRWPQDFQANPSELVGFLRGLFFVSPGYYRIIVFILQDAPFGQSEAEATGEEAERWLKVGLNALPRAVAARPFGEGTCTALIYEFQSSGSSAKIVGSGITGKQHLEKAGLLAFLEK